MRRNSYSMAFSISIFTSFCTAIPFTIACECEKLDSPQAPAPSKAPNYSLIPPSATIKQTDVATKNKKEVGEAKDKNLPPHPTQVNQETLDLQKRCRIGNSLFPTNCVPAKDVEEMQQMARTGSMEERLIKAGFSKERYDKFLKAVRSNDSKNSYSPAQ